MKTFTRKLRGNLHWVFFVLVVLLTVYMDVYVANNLLDGDASQLIAKGWLIKEQGNLFTDDLYLTTEVSFFDTSTLASLFFLFFDDWTLVRILTTVTMQAAGVAAFLFLCSQSKVRFPQALTVAGLLLLPVSIPYARCVLYHLYYLQYVTDLFLVLALVTRVLAAPKGRKRTGSWIVLALWSVYAGTVGIRYMLIIGLPLIVCTGLACLQKLNHHEWEDGKLSETDGSFWKSDEVRLLRVTGWICVFFVIGYIIYSAVLLPAYHFENTSSTWFYPDVPVQRYVDIFMGWLIASGIRSSMLPLVGLRGASLIASLGLSVCLFVFSARGLSERTGETAAARLSRVMFVISFAVTTLVFAFESYDETSRYYELYYLPVLVLAYPALAQEMSSLKERGKSAARKLLCLLACVCILFQSAYSLYFIRVEKNRMDSWSGLWYTEMDTADQVRDCVTFMQDNGYTHGYIDYWYANPMIELSDGALSVAGLEPYYEKSDSLVMLRWGTFKSAFEKENLPEKVIVFAKRSDSDDFESNFPMALLVHEGWIFNGYEVDSALIR